MNNETTTKTNAIISARIIAKVGEGMDIRQAIDAVCGEGTASAVIEDIYNALRSN